MTDHGDRLRETFESHESHNADPAEVYARVVELSRKHKRRRLGASVAGGTALGAGLIAAVVNLPAVLPGQGSSSGTAPIVAAGPASPAPSVFAEPDQKEFDAYFGAGYDYDDAVALAKLWKRSTNDIASVKAEAGRLLLAGQTLPIAPGSAEPAPDDVDPIPASVTKFFSAGYDYDDAVKLAKLWKLKTPYDAKVEGGKRLLAGQTLPGVKPDPAAAKEYRESMQAEAFFAAGYDVDDAIKLAKIWKLKTAWDAKVLGGKKLLAGQTLPIKP
ncbi:hypothetical protein GCM10010168_48600 [Actinoplanes ianthinogenes]|uniref:Uncharacterized protein n=1 Tax=Actinoplanes ianthinogenes TaxID=122358 RepID=A0ABM7LNJ5_9ACTN|nr:hypothetical protein [Actinoplanes ianthinogenes]BCJ40841.1 hypothetical protein Aiant_14980 [Actinoplanes ianthinogenes]GGR24857.1 hypothetical protein GCM10010168_48600 [Actinoplanes ianthinogenes]